MDVVDIARATHEANRVVQVATGDPAPSPPWDEAPEWQRESAVDGVRNALKGATPEQSHENWMAEKRRTGWTYGEVKDGDAKTHPCLVPYEQLPPEQRVKDDLFLAVVRALKPMLTEAAVDRG